MIRIMIISGLLLLCQACLAQAETTREVYFQENRPEGILRCFKEHGTAEKWRLLREELRTNNFNFAHVPAACPVCHHSIIGVVTNFDLYTLEVQRTGAPPAIVWKYTNYVTDTVVDVEDFKMLAAYFDWAEGSGVVVVRSWNHVLCDYVPGESASRGGGNRSQNCRFLVPASCNPFKLVRRATIEGSFREHNLKVHLARMAGFRERRQCLVWEGAGWKDGDKSKSVRFTAADFRNFPVFVDTITDRLSPLPRYLSSRFTAQSRAVLTDGKALMERQEEVLIADLNELLDGEVIYSKERFSMYRLSEETKRLMAQNPEGEQRRRLNRLLLEDAFPNFILMEPEPDGEAR